MFFGPTPWIIEVPMQKIENVQIIPAQSGWQVAFYIEGDETHASSFAYDDIVAWRIDKDTNRDGEPIIHSPIPITVEGEIAYWTNLWCIKLPTGMYCRPEDGTYRTETFALQAIDAEVAKEKARQKKTQTGN